MGIKNSELILNTDASIYHLNLKEENIADIIITVGDQDRVAKVTSFFDEVIFETQKREFKTQTGFYKGKKMTVISTGIGVDNIDIVLNELDALVNIDFETRKPKKQLKKLKFLRIGTSGSIQKEIDVDQFVISSAGLGFDGLIHFYKHQNIIEKEASSQLIKHLDLSPNIGQPYFIKADQELLNHFNDSSNSRINTGFTGTNIGFYGPQGRVLRIPLSHPDFIDRLAKFEYKNEKLTNLEMETSAIYGLAKLLGHQALSINAIIANRVTGNFSKRPKETVMELIEFSLNHLVKI